MRPRLNPALCRTWRAPGTLQFGVTPERAVVLGGLGPAHTAVLKTMDGHHDVHALRVVAAEAGGDAALADRLVDAVLSAGAAIDADAVADVVAPSSDTDWPGRRAPDAATLGLLDSVGDAGGNAMWSRLRQRVDVIGAGRVGAAVARLLAAAGIGEVTVEDGTRVRAADVSPAGLGLLDVGRARDRAVADLIRAELPERSVTTAADLVVVCPVEGTGRDQADDLMRAATPHLFAQVVETTGVVGPLVVPGHSSCLRCHDLRRTDRDRHWPMVLHELATRPPTEPACDVSLATAVAGLAAGQALAHLDGFEVAAVDGTIEIVLPYGLPRRRSWQPHPACGCTWGEWPSHGTMAG